MRPRNLPKSSSSQRGSEEDERRDRKKSTLATLLLAALGLLALYSAMVGYSGLQAKLTTSPTAKAEARFHEIVEKAQYYYHRPDHLGGGDASFEGLDFARLGFEAPAGALEWTAPEGRFRLENLRRDTFDLVAETPGGRLEGRGIVADERVEVRRIK